MKGIARQRVRNGRCLGLALCFGLMACTETGKKGEDPVPFAEYQITAAEGAASVTCIAQFRQQRNGPAVSLPAGARLLLDDQPFRHDSSAYTGPFYECVLPLRDFAGTHRLRFAHKKKESTDTFAFDPFTLDLEPDVRLERHNFHIKLSTALPNRLLMVSLTDTAFWNNDFQGRVAVRNGVLHLPPESLARVESGPVHLVVTEEKTIPLRSEMRSTLQLRYTVERELVLTGQ